MEMKIVVIGDANAGKTNLINCITKKAFEEHSRPTLGVDFSSKDFMVNGKVVSGQIWDTAGQQQYRGLPKLYYRFAKGVLIVFDVSSRASFEHCKEWLSEVRDFIDDDEIPIVLVGNKSDLFKELQMVTIREAEELANELQLSGCFFTSALKADNVYATFQKVVELACERDDGFTQDVPIIRYRKSVSKKHIEEKRVMSDSFMFRTSSTKGGFKSTRHYSLENSGCSPFRLEDRAANLTFKKPGRRGKCCK